MAASALIGVMVHFKCEESDKGLSLQEMKCKFLRLLVMYICDVIRWRGLLMSPISILPEGLADLVKLERKKKSGEEESKGGMVSCCVFGSGIGLSWIRCYTCSPVMLHPIKSYPQMPDSASYFKAGVPMCAGQKLEGGVLHVPHLLRNMVQSRRTWQMLESLRNCS